MTTTKIHTYYKVLGLPSGANASQIRAAHRQLAAKWHPDVNPSPDALARMKLVNVARDALIEHVASRPTTRDRNQYRNTHANRNRQDHTWTKSNQKSQRQKPPEPETEYAKPFRANYDPYRPGTGTPTLSILAVVILVLAVMNSCATAANRGG